jgi:hypothetical protein
MTNSWRTLVATASVLLVPAIAAAQVTSMPRAVCERIPLALTPATIDALTSAYNQGSWPDLQKTAAAVVAATKSAVSSDCAELLDENDHFIAVSWVRWDVVADKPAYRRVLFHRSAVDPFTSDLPGIAGPGRSAQLVNLFVGRSAHAEAVEVYTSTREENPILGQVPGLIQAIAGPLFAAAGGLGGSAARTAEANPDRIFATVSALTLPYRRAAVRLQGSARDAVDRTELSNAITKLLTTVDFKEAAYSECARNYANDLVTSIIPSVIRSQVCGTQKADPFQCSKDVDVALHDAYTSAHHACGSGKPSKEDVEAIQSVDQQFRTLLTSGVWSSASIDLTFHNRPTDTLHTRGGFWRDWDCAPQSASSQIGRQQQHRCGSPHAGPDDGVLELESTRI